MAHNPDKQQEIMRAAERLFARRRYHEVTTGEIARTAKVGKGTIYRHFRHKEDLFFAVATSGFDELCELLSRKVHDDASFDAQLLSACRAISGFFESRRNLLRVMQAEDDRIASLRKTFRERWLAKRRKLIEALAGILARGMVSGRISCDARPDILAQFLLGMLRTRACELAEASDDDKRLELLIDLFCNGALGAAGKAGGLPPVHD